MVMNTVHATYTETYDLNTAINEISLMGIHTPQAPALKTMFRGFFENYKKYKIVGCNIGMVCASQQSLNPLEVGMSSGQADPRDVLNPILFKACTGENLNEILNQIYGTTGLVQDTSSVSQSIDSTVASTNMYYQLLSDDSWRKEHPQRGLFVQGLKPFVHKVVTTQPFRWTGSSSSTSYDYPEIPGAGANDSTQYHPVNFGSPGGQPTKGDYRDYAPNISNPSVFISDGITDMPWLDTTYSGSINVTRDQQQVAIRSQNIIVSVPRVFCGCIVLPPAIVQRLFFRLQISWHVMFKDFRPAFEVGPISSALNDVSEVAFGELQAKGSSLLGETNPPTYWNIYHDASTKLEKEFSSFDVNGGAEVQQVMENVS